jgi:hypothetical protein
MATSSSILCFVISDHPACPLFLSFSQALVSSGAGWQPAIIALTKPEREDGTADLGTLAYSRSDHRCAIEWRNRARQQIQNRERNACNFYPTS